MPDYLRVPRIELPADWIPEGTVCALVPIPDDPEFLAQLVGLIDQLRQSRNFARDATKTGAATVSRTWDRALASRPIVTVDCEGAMAVFDVRQNDEDPCILEKSDDGGETWIPFADLTLCPPLLSVSSDGTKILYWCPTCGPGGTPGWREVPNPDEDYNPAYDDPQTPAPEDWVEAGSDPCCVYAANLTEAIKSIMERVDFGLETGVLAQTVYATAMNIYLTVNRLMAKRISQILQQIVLNTLDDYATFNADYEAFDWQEMTDLFCCFFEDDGTVTEAGFNNALSVISSQSSPVWDLTKIILTEVGPVGISNASTFAGITAGDCEPDCDPALSECWFFRDDDYDFVAVPGKGTWSSATYWKGQLVGSEYQLDITCTTGIPAGVIDEMRVDWAHSGQDKIMRCYVNGVLKREVLGGSAGFRTTTFPVGEAVTSVRIYLSQNTLNTTVTAYRVCFYRT